MIDLKIDNNDDLCLSETGDIQIVDDIIQNAKISIRWILDEWRLNPDLGLPWFEEILVKNPNLAIIKQHIKNAITSIKGVTDANVEILEYNQKERSIRFSISINVDEETYSEEVVING